MGAKELPKSILLPFMSTMIQSLYYIPAMRDAVASKPDGDKAVASTPDRDKAHPALANLRVAFDSIRDQETAGPLPDSLCGQLWDSLQKHLDGETPSSTPHAWEMILEALLAAPPSGGDATEAATTDADAPATETDAGVVHSNGASAPRSAESFVRDIFSMHMQHGMGADDLVTRTALTFPVSTLAVNTENARASGFEDLLLRSCASPDRLDKLTLASPTTVFTLVLKWPHRAYMPPGHAQSALSLLKPSIRRSALCSGDDDAEMRATVIFCHGFGAHSAFVCDEKRQWHWIQASKPVVAVGASWATAMQRIVEEKLQPVVLVYVPVEN